MINIQDSLNRIDEKKKKLDATRPLPIALVRNLQEWFSIEFTYTSNALEGNTLSMSETAMVVEKGITIGGKTVREHLEAINHAQAIDFIRELAQKKQADIALDDILAIHKIVLQKIDDMHAGIFLTPCSISLHTGTPGKSNEAGDKIAGSSTIFPNAAKVPFLMIDFITWLQEVNDHPVIVAALAHYKLVTIHPFIDGPPSLQLWRTEPFEALAKEGNGRTARLLMNLILLQHGYPLAIIKKEKRTEYIAAIQHARQTDDFEKFYAVIIDAVEYVLDAYLEAVEQSNLA